MESWLEEFLTLAWGPSGPVIVITAIVALLLPVLLHLILYRARAPKASPSFLIIGPSGSGKTALLTALEKGESVPTHTSQAPITVEVRIPSSTQTESSKYRSENDPSLAQRPKILVTDTPGHGKLRHHSFNLLKSPPQSLAGVIFVVDATSLSSDVPGRSAPGLTEAAEFLHDALLELQTRYMTAKTSRGPGEVHFLIAANKMDLFTALPANLVKSALEAEITRIRATRARGLADSGVKVEEGEDEGRGWLGEGGEGKFDFGQVEGSGITVDVRGGNVTGGDGVDVKEWWSWIGEQL